MVNGASQLAFPIPYFLFPIPPSPLTHKQRFVVGLRPAKTIKHARQPVT
jgi:hypothetical protein